MRFSFVAECTFEAQDLDEAVRMLSNHFLSLESKFPDAMRDACALQYEGHMTVEPIA